MKDNSNFLPLIPTQSKYIAKSEYSHFRGTSDQNWLSRSVLGVFGLDIHVGRERNVESCAKYGTDGSVTDRIPSDERVAII